MICARFNLIADQRGKPDMARGLENQPITFYLRNVVIESLPQYDSCEIITIPASYDNKPNAFAFQKDSPYLKLFNYYLNAMEEKGLTHQIKEKYKKLPQYCPDKSGKYDMGNLNNRRYNHLF